jgi:hypothetical protein
MQCGSQPSPPVMPALVAGIHVFTALANGLDVDGRDKPRP